jgi:hypothetical protein
MIAAGVARHLPTTTAWRGSGEDNNNNNNNYSNTSKTPKDYRYQVA